LLLDAVLALHHPLQGVEALKAANRELAAANLAAGEEQVDKRNQMAIIRSSEYAPAKAAFDTKWRRQQAVLAKLSPEVLMRRWGAAVGRA
jgi:ESCRT-I complex subunit VPS37